jgi:formamidopyrimidine-DNA glycosylase
MIEMPEATTIARQMNETLTGKTIARFGRGNKTHKFLWLNRPDEEYETILPGLSITGASSFGRSIYLHLEDHMLWWSDAGGKLLYHAPGENLPKNYHLAWEFEDGSALTYALQMWGAVKLLDQSEFSEKPNDETGIEPLSPGFTIERFNEMLDEYPEKTSKGIKGFLVATGYVMPKHIAGLGNAIVQDILFHAGISPKRKVMDISPEERENLFEAINGTIAEAIELGGRYDEVDLFGQPGRYIRLMDSKTVGTPCIHCGADIQKISYLGGACYLCLYCQKNAL